MHKLFLALFLQAVLMNPAHATSVELEVSQGSGTKSQQIFADGNFGKKEEDEDKKTTFNWNGSYTHSTTEAKQTSGSIITDNTNSVWLGAGFGIPSGFNGSLGLNYSKTPEEDLSSYGPSVTLSYRYKFSHPQPTSKKDLKVKEVAQNEKSETENVLESTEEQFSPSVGLSLTGGFDNYVQQFSRVTRRKVGAIARPTTGNNEIQKKNLELTLSVHPLSWMTAKASYTKYSYSKDVGQFLQYLDVHAVGRLSSGMEGALAGFYDNTKTFELNFFIGDDWELDFEQALSKVLVDQSDVTYSRVYVYYNISDSWRIGVGGDYTKSESSTASTTTDNSGLASLSYSY